MVQDHTDTEEWVLDRSNSLIDLPKWQRVTNLMGELCNAPAAFIVQYTSKGFQVVIASETEVNPYDAGTHLSSDVNIFCRKVAQNNKFLYENHATVNPEWATNPAVADDDFNSYLGFPVRWPDGNMFGTCCVMDYAVTDYDKKYLNLVEEFAGIVENDLVLVDQHEKLKELSHTDPLTGLYNRRGFFSLGNEKLALAKRLNQSITLLYCDIDDMKKINDEHGHKVGDDVLIEVATCIKNIIRKYDLASRMGGDEFVILCMVNDKNEVANLVDRLKESIRIDAVGSAPVKLSVGQADLTLEEEQNLDDLIYIADKIMYKVKETTKANNKQSNVN